MNNTALLDHLNLLCAQPSVTGQARGLAEGADGVVSVLRDVGLDTRIVKTGGAPLVVGRYDAGAAKTVVMYGRYDVPPAGARRQWTDDPFRPTIRDDAVYARGAVVKGELVARIAALRTLIEQKLPLNVVVVVEGESLLGSPHLHVAAENAASYDFCLWSGGGFDASGLPLLYTGVKGLLQVELEAATANVVVPMTYAATLRNPVWRIVQVLGSIKSEFEEILLEGFYDEVNPLSREALSGLQGLDVGEAARREAWGVEHFLAGVSGPMLGRTETVSPACNISSLSVNGVAAPSIPQRANVELQWQLVPDLTPERVLELLTTHLQTRGFNDVQIKQIPGAYAPVLSPALPFDAAQLTVNAYGQPARVLPIAPFAAPVALLASTAPMLSCGIERPTSALFGADEHVPIADLTTHTQFVTELLRQLAV